MGTKMNALFEVQRFFSWFLAKKQKLHEITCCLGTTMASTYRTQHHAVTTLASKSAQNRDKHIKTNSTKLQCLLAKGYFQNVGGFLDAQLVIANFPQDEPLLVMRIHNDSHPGRCSPNFANLRRLLSRHSRRHQQEHMKSSD